MSKEHAYAYEAGYHDGATHYELDHCPSCKNTADLQDALAENAKLRELMYERAHKHAIHHMTEDELRITAANVMDENAKLRELVLNLYKRFHGVVLENWSYSTEDFDMLACCMRELGVEVEE